MELSENLARKFADIALGHVAREYPHKLDHVMAGESDIRHPRDLHPAFFGSFDWHSCVHGWWTLLTLRRLYPLMPQALATEALADTTFTQSKIATELAYFERSGARAFERPYGWAWLLYLHHEAERHGDREWGAQLEPLAQALAQKLCAYLHILDYPITSGTHGNTAFALTLAREWAEPRNSELLSTIDRWSLKAFGEKKDYAGWEPGGDEFLSPVLTGALLMSRIMPNGRFAAWLKTLVIDNGWLARECRPVIVSDRSDGKIAHLDGLNLSRAWCLFAMRNRLGADSDWNLLDLRADEHLARGIEHIAGDYAGEHWLASFALLAVIARDEGRA
ncbi:Protein of unknown function [Altererythrobacter xiamenensis]|uniref:DUF2891 domain-containing protein n=1 Tax=Altererythrobacter xiamenensis TaxID=1316679 RepID=A0A1Y6EPM8_9SPHN|nr:DUF2891 domain-containing protein [Altererythrobacter xiamenensis]SMQ63171.1 Protein of unknown function [Altererythrobacter xiamenensis]